MALYNIADYQWPLEPPPPEEPPPKLLDELLPPEKLLEEKLPDELPEEKLLEEPLPLPPEPNVLDSLETAIVFLSK